MENKDSKSKPKESIGHCYICKKELFREDSKDWVYHNSVGAVCLRHPGVKEWYDELLKNS